MKTEIKVHEFVKFIRNSNMAEIFIWLLSLILYCSTPSIFTKSTEGEESYKSYKNFFIFFHLLHIIRALLGIFLIITFPKSFDLVTNLESNLDTKLERALFNDLIGKLFLIK